jgi:transcription-repair coupling factor (superfamily II helicase)
MRDLEMRGAGEMLGTRQHGYIAAVGFHLYTRLLAQAVKAQRHARNLPAGPEEAAALREGLLPVSVDLPLSIGIPVDYIPDQDMRLKLYRRLVNLKDEVEIDSMVEEFKDRFGTMPGMVANLFYQLKVKLRGEAVGLSSIAVEGDQLVLRYPPLSDGVTSRDLPYIGPNVRIGKNAYWLPYASQPHDWQERLLDTLSVLNAVKVA